MFETVGRSFDIALMGSIGTLLVLTVIGALLGKEQRGIRTREESRLESIFARAFFVLMLPLSAAIFVIQGMGVILSLPVLLIAWTLGRISPSD